MTEDDLKSPPSVLFSVHPHTVCWPRSSGNSCRGTEVWWRSGGQWVTWACRHGRCRCRTVMGLWCGMMTSRGASVWTRGHGMWDTSVSSTATAPCTETHCRRDYYVCLYLFFMISAGIDLAHWCQHAASNMTTGSTLTLTPSSEDTVVTFYSAVHSLYFWRSAVIK